MLLEQQGSPVAPLPRPRWGWLVAQGPSQQSRQYRQISGRPRRWAGGRQGPHSPQHPQEAPSSFCRCIILHILPPQRKQLSSPTFPVPYEHQPPPPLPCKKTPLHGNCQTAGPGWLAWLAWPGWVDVMRRTTATVRSSAGLASIPPHPVCFPLVSHQHPPPSLSVQAAQGG